MKLVTSDNHEIIFIEKNISNDKVVLLCHGISAEKNENGIYSEFSKEIEQNGISTFRFDFRGHGESSIKSKMASISGMLIDLFTVLDYLSRKYNNIDILASSFGASITILLLDKLKLEQIRNICFWNPVTNYASTFTNTTLPWGSSFFPQNGLQDVLLKTPIQIGNKDFYISSLMALEMFYYKPYKINIKEKCNDIIIMHGMKDNIVSYNDSLNYSKEFNIKLISLIDSSHGLEEEQEKVFNLTKKFFTHE